MCDNYMAVLYLRLSFLFCTISKNIPGQRKAFSFTSAIVFLLKHKVCFQRTIEKKITRLDVALQTSSRWPSVIDQIHTPSRGQNLYILGEAWFWRTFIQLK